MFELKDGTVTANIPGLSTITATGILVRYADATAAVDVGDRLSISGVTDYVFSEAPEFGTIAFAWMIAEATVADFISFSGDLGFRKQGNSDIVAVGANLTASLDAGDSFVESEWRQLWSANRRCGTFEPAEGTFAVEIPGLTEITATSTLIRYADTASVTEDTT